MALAETRMKTAVRVVDRALRNSPEASLSNRLAGFRRAYAAIIELNTGDESWSEDVLSAAWSIVEDAYPQGGPVGDIIAALEETHETVVDTVVPSAPRRPSKPRRDA